jgi:hypothetical protein
LAASIAKNTDHQSTTSNSTPLAPVSQTDAELQSLLAKRTDGTFHRS